MTKNIEMKNVSVNLLVVIFLLVCSVLTGQSFEGKITYKLEMQNPYPDNVTAEQWADQLKAVFGEKGYMTSNYYYKEANYVSEIEAGKELGFQLYNPKDGLIYSWQKGTLTAVTLDSKKNMDGFVEFVDSEETETVMDIPCQVIIIKSKLGEMKIWYNSDHFKVDPSLFTGHVYGHYEKMLEKTGSLPIKTEVKGLAGHIIMTMIDFKKETVDDSKFVLPEFTEVTANPMN